MKTFPLALRCFWGKGNKEAHVTKNINSQGGSGNELPHRVNSEFQGFIVRLSFSEGVSIKVFPYKQAKV